MKKATIKDIAKAVGVSIATVSYILNDVKTQSISDETRVKVLKAAQQLKYVTNRTAQSLKVKKTGLIGILWFKGQDRHVWSDLKYARTINAIERHCSELGYHVLFMQIDNLGPSSKIIMERNLDGVFLMNVDQEQFTTISHYFGFGVPVFVIDSYIEDPLFHKIVPDFVGSFQAARSLLGEAPQFLVMDSYNNAELMEFIKRESGLDEGRIHVFDSIEGMNEFLSAHAGRPGIVLNEFLAHEAAKTHNRFAVLCTSHCPEIVPQGMAKVAFDLNDYKEIVRMMDRNIQDADEVSREKFYCLSVIT
ncbi:LacI family DNA-binding transcriptional regulator [Paenibacillus oleatilyticus]|uniref:LacI family DNA-binding transcriptional regulator n=1 Tax=Paenibacillus oleatilyticus TaxID=2594886 RepID=A0ABV4UXD5_9BACL